MRTLVEQTASETKQWLGERLWDGKSDHRGRVGLHILMGGEEAHDWDAYPEADAILIGTQDMLLSRALNRGYGLSRYRWPMHFGLLNNDCLWIMDETQLMGPGLWTSAQLDWMRQDRFRAAVPCPTWWMSATLRPTFLQTKDRLAARQLAPLPEPVRIGDDPALAHLTAARRPCSFWQSPMANAPAAKKSGRKSAPMPLETDPTGPFLIALAAEICAQHKAGTLTLAVCNQVRTARKLAQAVRDGYQGTDEVILLTSRFRPGDRRRYEARLLAYENARKAHVRGKGPSPERGLICISTQVVEAGLDISARRLWSEVAPWPSIVQRLGRLNRDGQLDGEAAAYFWRLPLPAKSKADERIGPYLKEDLDRASGLLEKLTALYRINPGLSAHAALERLRAGAQQEMETALEPKREPFPRALDVHGLFSTEPDLFGGFTDVSPYVRGADPDTDLTVFWRQWDQKHQLPTGEDLAGPVFSAAEGCPVPVYELAKLLDKTAGYCWEPKREIWEPIRASDLCPGMVIMLPATAGGYRPEAGWTAKRADLPGEVPPPGPASERYEDDRFSALGHWVELPMHLADVERAAAEITRTLPLPNAQLRAVIVGARFHDLGKSLWAWQDALPLPLPDAAAFWAKGPHVLKVRFARNGGDASQRAAVGALLTGSGLRLRAMADAEEGGRRVLRWQADARPKRTLTEQLEACAGVEFVGAARFRPGLRHEVGSALALWHRYYRGDGAREFPALTIYLVAAHHGKARTVLSARHPDGQDVCGVDRSTVALPYPPPAGTLLDFSGTADGAAGEFTDAGFVFHAPGWTGLVGELLGPWETVSDQPAAGAAVPDSEPGALGPLALAYLETLLRAADERASARPSATLEVDHA